MSLVSSYTAGHGDSDEEVEPLESLSGNISDEDEHRSPVVAPRKRPAEETYSPVVKDSDSSDRQQPKKWLVSYGDADDDDDDDNEDDESSGDGYALQNKHREELVKAGDPDAQLSGEPVLNPEQASSLSRSVQNVPASDIELPPEPKGRCSPTVQNKISDMDKRVKRDRRININRSIQEKKEFRNPSIYEKLIEYINIDEKGTNYPPEIYNPKLWGKDSFYDELARIQKVEMDKREKERKERTKVEFVTGTKPTSSGSDAEKRKTKWDSSLAAAAAAPQPTAATTAVAPAGSASLAKSTVIPATGSLTKKKV